MKKRLLPVFLTMILLMTFIPFGPSAVASGEFTAQLRGQLDTDVSTSIGEWAIQDVPEANIVFDMYEPATISMTFDEPIKFTGNWTGLRTSVKVSSDTEAETLGGRILSFIVDGEDLGSRYVPLINHDGEGELAFDIARVWGASVPYDAYGLAGMDPFTSLEIVFVVGHTATLLGQLDSSVNTDVPEWGIGDIPEATVPVVIGEPTTISMEFSNPIKFTGNWTGIATGIPVRSDADAEATGAHITAFVVDGNDLGSKMVPLINRDNDGWMTIDIARQWGGDYDDYDLAGMDPFSTLEITFVVPNMPLGEVGEEVGIGNTVLPTGGNAWIAGTVLYAGRTDDVEEGIVDWYSFVDQSIAFEMGVPFTVVLDLGSETATHDVAHWDGYIICIDTDVDSDPAFFEAFIDTIVLNGRELSFNASNVVVGSGDDGLRIALSSTWNEAPFDDPSQIGTFSKLEITLVIGEYGVLENPFGAIEATPEPAPPPVVAPIERPEPTPPPSEGLPGWVIPVIIGAVVVIAGVVAFVVIKNKKKPE